MKINILLLICVICGNTIGGQSTGIYPVKGERATSPGNTTYFINPADGSDTHTGLKKEQAWQTFAPINRLTLTVGDRVNVIAPGSFDQTLMITGSGTAKAPIIVHFAPGRYDFYPTKALSRKYQITNSNDDPDGDKAIGMLFDGAKHVEVSGKGARIVYRGKMIEVCIDSSENITISDLTYDYHRPTVSEFRPTAIEKDYVDIEIHKDSAYEIKDGKIRWIGEGWSYKTGHAQELDVATNEIWRRKDPLKNLKLKELKPFHIRAVGKHSMSMGRVYQIRNVKRDCVGAFIRRSKNISWKNVQFNFIHGLGLVHQFSENLMFDRVSIAPDKESGRTSSAWGDAIHISGCRGKVIVKNCTFSGTQDDPINIHGTHLRVVERISEKQIRLKFMQHQTFGFMAFNVGDAVNFAHSDTLQIYGPNRVKDAQMKGAKEMILTLEDPVPAELQKNDVLENVTWTPEVAISGCKVMLTPTRGFLITTRKKVVVEDNDFHRTHRSAILLENDARGWFESGPIRDMTIRNNRFFHCYEPVIYFNPQNSKKNSAVHQNIRIENNTFTLSHSLAVKAKSVTGLTITGNTVFSKEKLTDKQAMKTSDCKNVKIEKNQYLPLPE